MPRATPKNSPAAVQAVGGAASLLAAAYAPTGIARTGTLVSVTT